MTGYVHDLPDLDPNAIDRLGGKGAGLGRMHRLGLPVPPAFVIDTDACRTYREDGGTLPEGLPKDIGAAMERLQAATGKGFVAGDGVPLLVSVRSGAKISMPGMMDTVLNLGLDRNSVLRLAAAGGDEFAVDTWLRFWAMFADIVLDCDGEWLKQSVAEQRDAAAAGLTPETAAALETAIVAGLEDEGAQAPVDPADQLIAAVRAVFSSWDSRRAKAYRAHHGIPDDLGTAVVVQAMVFGNLGGLSGSGVAFTRDPKTGENRLFGEFLAGGQGEEVVAGTKTPVDLAEPRAHASDSDERGTSEEDKLAMSPWADVVAELEAFGRRLEREYTDALDIEFTVEDGKLYLLQVRAAKRTAAAAVATATQLVDEGLITTDQALHRVTPDQLRKLVDPEFDAAALAQAETAGKLLVSGIGASPGHGSGVAVLDADRAAHRAASGEPVVLVRATTSPQDLPGMLAAQAVVTARGGATSHAAVVARALDKPCVTGCSELAVRPDEGVFLVDGKTYPEGTFLSVDGATGRVYAADIPRGIPESNLTRMAALLGWADAASSASVWVPTTVGAQWGVGVVALTDLLLGVGRLDVLIDALGTLSADPGAKVAEHLVPAIRAGLDPLLVAAGEQPVDLRLPVLSSARARRSVGEWASLAPELLRPLGSQALLDAYLTAIGQSAAATGHQRLTVHIGGVSSAAEVSAFAQRLGDAGLCAGAVLQNAAVLARPEQLAATGAALWVDLPELIRTSCGQPAELLFDAVDEGLVPLVEDLLVGLARAGSASRIGVDLSGGSVTALAPALHRMGYRHFAAAAAGQAEALRLLLGRTAVPTPEANH
ncbi:MAG TPA: pyruvate, phosphate dikinase [Sporichthyaceae bacterium]|jgi:pyruvate,orthophosphate dikinase|nr:pyruvate, phosphate dikinase [Sporichthyaceae bacterium]